MKLRKFILFSISLACIVLFYYCIVQFSWSELTEFSILTIINLLLLTIAGTVLYVSLILFQARRLEYDPSFLQTYLVLTSSLTANYITPVKIGIPIRIFLYKEIMGINVTDGSSMVTIEIIVGLFLPAIISVIGLPVLFPGHNVFPIFFFFLVFFCGIVFFLKLDKKSSIFSSKIFSLKIFQKIQMFIFDFRNSLHRFSPLDIMLIVGIDAVMLFLQTFRLMLVIDAFGYGTTFVVSLIILVASITVGNVSMLPMGLGARDISFTVLLCQAGVPAGVAVACAATQRLFSPGWPLLLGIISSNYLGVSTLIKNRSSTNNSGSSSSKLHQD